MHYIESYENVTYSSGFLTSHMLTPSSAFAVANCLGSTGLYITERNGDLYCAKQRASELF